MIKSYWDSMSDEEINIKVAEALGYTYEGTSDPYHVDDIYHIISKGGYERPLPDFCNHIVYAWDVIDENKISVMFEKDSSKPFVVSGLEIGMGGDMEWEESEEHTNPLRAAMIVFLMMKEEEKNV